MTAYQPAYRVTLYQPRSIDATETDPLSPAAGAIHSDDFKVSSIALAGWKAYLHDDIGGRHSQLDVLQKHTDTGWLSLRIIDKRESGSTNLERWVTAFSGDAKGGQLLQGRKAFVEESTDAGATWSPFFTGRVRVLELAPNKVDYRLEIEELADELEADIFITAPASDVSIYAHQAQLWPLGLLQSYGDFSVEAKAKGFVSNVIGSSAFHVDISRIQTGAHRFAVTKALIDTWLTFDPDATIAEITPTAGGATSTWRCSGGVKGNSLITAYIEAHPSSGAAPSNGTEVFLTIRPNKAPISKALPLLIDDVHPVTLWKNMLDGYFGRLDSVGDPLTAVAYDTAAFAALEADETFPTFRGFFTERMKRAQFIEKYICQAYHLGYIFDGNGKVVPLDLRRTATTTPVATITNADISLDSPPAWRHDGRRAVTSVTATYYVEKLIPQQSLPAPWQGGPNTEAEYPEIPACLLEEADAILRLEEFGTRIGDVKPRDVKLDAKGLRFRGGPRTSSDQVNIAGGSEVPEQLNGMARQDYIRRYLEGYAIELKSPFGLGETSVELPGLRSSANVAAVGVGDWVAIDVDELPDPATNLRGGARLGLCVGRTEQGPGVPLRIIDGGANATCLPPTLGAPAQATGLESSAITQAVTLNAAGDFVQLALAITETTEGTRPAEDSPLWASQPIVRNTGTDTITQLPAGKRIWTRARSVSVPGKSFKLPSAWAFPGSGTGYVDTAAISAPTGLSTNSTAADRVTASWTNAVATAEIIVFLKAGASVTGAASEIVATLPPGTTDYEHAGAPMGAVSTQFTLGVAHRTQAGTSAIASSTFTSAAAQQTLDPPTNPTPFSFGSQRPRSGFGRGPVFRSAIPPGTYGLAVIDGEGDLPSDTEFREAVETAVGSGSFGSYTTVARVPTESLSEWTLFSTVGPRDFKKRRLSARHVRGEATSAWTTDVEVTPWTDIPLPPPGRSAVQLTISVLETGAVEVAVDGPDWVGSYKYSTSTVSFPTEATVRSSGTTSNGRQIVISLGAATLGLGDTIYVTVIPYSQSGALGYEGPSSRGRATRHDASATKTVLQAVASLKPTNSDNDDLVLFTTGYVTNVNWGVVSRGVDFRHQYIIPDGTTITAVGGEVYRDATNDTGNVTFALIRVDTDGTETIIAETGVQTSGWESLNASCSELTTGRRYVIRLRMESFPPILGENWPSDSDLRASAFSYTYTMPSTVNAI